MGVEIAPGQMAIHIPQYNSRFIVRSPAGIPYCILRVEGNDSVEKIQVFKGNGIVPTSFATQDYANAFTTQWSGVDVPWNPVAAIDSTGIIHIMWQGEESTVPYIKYITFNTSTDLFGTVETVIANTGRQIYSSTEAWCGIVIDSNNIPHVVYQCRMGTKANNYKTVMYNNRIGGAWNASSTVVRGQPDGLNCFSPTITIDQDNKPFIACGDDSTPGYVFHELIIGNANDATTWTVYTVGACWSLVYALGIDKNGNHYVGFDQGSTGGYGISFLKHTKGDAWTTWAAFTSGSWGWNSSNGIGMSVDGNDVYVFYQRSSDPNGWNRYQSGSWKGEAYGDGTYGYGRWCKWASWVDFDRAGQNRGLGGANVGGRMEIDCAYEDAYASVWFVSLTLIASSPKTNVLQMMM
jgi:hypothetical protein